ncbi:MAG TPA: hypothetical protein VGM69_18190 [Chloroflexota bacterium]
MAAALEHVGPGEDRLAAQAPDVVLDEAELDQPCAGSAATAAATSSRPQVSASSGWGPFAEPRRSGWWRRTAERFLAFGDPIANV